MNYRHIYHAGGFWDVFKHALLAHVLSYLRQKEAPFAVLDTHAGIGMYDLQSVEALKTREYEQGIVRLLSAPELPPALTPYAQAVRAANASNQAIRYYPGSPAVAHHGLRPQDRLVLAELHPDDAWSLKHYFHRDSQVSVHHMDGYSSLKAHLPPREKRGVMLMDPAFEEKDEFESMVTGLKEAYRRWSTGVFMLWYPIKERPAIWAFEEAVIALGIRRILKTELLVHPEDTHLRLNGCGMLIVNPPWKMDETWRPALDFLSRTLAPGTGQGTVTWLVPE